MGNYSPSGNSTNYTFQASGPLTGGDPTEFSGNAQVKRFAGGHYAGIAAYDVAAGSNVVVYIGNLVFPGAAGTVAEGVIHTGDDLTASSVPGHQVKTATAGDEVIGRAFSDAVDGGLVKWHQR